MITQERELTRKIYEKFYRLRIDTVGATDFPVAPAQGAGRVLTLGAVVEPDGGTGAPEADAEEHGASGRVLQRLPGPEPASAGERGQDQRQGQQPTAEGDARQGRAAAAHRGLPLTTTRASPPTIDSLAQAAQCRRTPREELAYERVHTAKKTDD